MATGIGPKQASLFLRNTGFGGELAVLDVHVLRFMEYMGLCPKVPKTVSTLREYEALEQILLGYARGLGWGLQVLDQAIWISMRVAKKVSLWPLLR
jgi:N-glycosylase/DNA lyase